MAEGGYDPKCAGPSSARRDDDPTNNSKAEAGPMYNLMLMETEDDLKKRPHQLDSDYEDDDDEMSPTPTRPIVIKCQEDLDFPNYDLNWATVDEIKGLGRFNSDTTKHLEGMPEFVYNHQEASQHIKHFIEQEVQMDPESFDSEDKEKLKEDLSYLAFTEDTAGQIALRIPNHILKSQNASYWGTNFLLKWIFCNHVGPFMYMSTSSDSWFEHGFKVTCGQNSEKEIRVYNEENHPIDASSEFWDDDGGTVQYFYHGTDWKSVESILRNGIILNGGNFGHDFSYRHRPGFYVSDNLNSSKEWAETTAACPAVIVFKVPTEVFREASRHMDLNGKPTDFKREVYAYNRSNGEEKVRTETLKEVEGSKTIKGPLLLNPGVLRGMDQSELELSQDLQVCILDEEVARRLYSSIESIIYYKKRELNSVPAGEGE